MNNIHGRDQKSTVRDVGRESVNCDVIKWKKGEFQKARKDQMYRRSRKIVENHPRI